MARKSLDSRLDRIMDALLPVGSMERAEYFLHPTHRAALTSHRQQVAAIIGRFKNSEPGSWFAAYLDGEPTAQVPPMPDALRKALRLTEPPLVTPDMDDAQVARAWNRYALGDEQ